MTYAPADPYDTDPSDEPGRMAICYKCGVSRQEMFDRMAITEARFKLENPRETKAFAIRNRAGKWSITSVQMRSNVAHTLCGRAAVRFRFFSMLNRCLWRKMTVATCFQNLRPPAKKHFLQLGQ